ncbi:hypothetical protein BELL_0028g00060 [Botrytis elliptica]|uniref:Uncharacterized protein n=1 Tax=Botrytis elliptica TaxID=278938 RepID=A0A4Z1K6B4_9HELO|nr:hypothetical protein BELL_0028g00060 [Botrytis elliptica]
MLTEQVLITGDSDCQESSEIDIRRSSYVVGAGSMISNATNNYQDGEGATSPKSCSTLESDARPGGKDFDDTLVPSKSFLNHSLHLTLRAFSAHDLPALTADMVPAKSHTVIPTGVDNYQHTISDIDSPIQRIGDLKAWK